jgi:hypothetical protein
MGKRLAWKRGDFAGAPIPMGSSESIRPCKVRAAA